MSWINPDKKMPNVGDTVIIAIGITDINVETYRLADVVENCGFLVRNGPYAPYVHYSSKNPRRINNAYRVIAWANFEKCNTNDLDME